MQRVLENLSAVLGELTAIPKEPAAWAGVTAPFTFSSTLRVHMETI